jgi:hypothetical protein
LEVDRAFSDPKSNAKRDAGIQGCTGCLPCSLEICADEIVASCPAMFSCPTVRIGEDRTTLKTDRDVIHEHEHLEIHLVVKCCGGCE